MRAASFMTALPPTNERGYPPQLAVAVATVAIVTCLVSLQYPRKSALLPRDIYMANTEQSSGHADERNGNQIIEEQIC